MVTPGVVAPLAVSLAAATPAPVISVALDHVAVTPVAISPAAEGRVACGGLRKYYLAHIYIREQKNPKMDYPQLSDTWRLPDSPWDFSDLRYVVFFSSCVATEVRCVL